MWSEENFLFCGQVQVQVNTYNEMKSKQIVCTFK